MTLGEKIKQLRQGLGLSQPELAERVGIEQSYLSKLENDKSLPSNDMFRNLMSALGQDVPALIASGELADDMERLKQISDVEILLKQRSGKLNQQRKLLLIFSSLLLVLAVGSFYAGYSRLLFTENYYVYVSKGVENLDEPDGMFDIWRRLVVAKEGEDIRALLDQKEQEIYQRGDIKTLVTPDYRGQGFTENVEGGKRTYELEHQQEIPRPVNA
ncbi:helix-turn-helix domain-containing protein [Shewanella submarina]|uniref:Helix-turn-helix domain-containing protein n=1 Tax=Shewanella submarina TaxID=2016376 RepID=A0ABV7GIP3_9GAMM|nr:helix-turn-helix transcriptional regulator [Shewanella submarina]MCL1038919.1 helix-turn-helix domain-containing protein [Shewanella submarina]